MTIARKKVMRQCPCELRVFMITINNEKRTKVTHMALLELPLQPVSGEKKVRMIQDKPGACQYSSLSAEHLSYECAWPSIHKCQHYKTSIDILREKYDGPLELIRLLYTTTNNVYQKRGPMCDAFSGHF